MELEPAHGAITADREGYLFVEVPAAIEILEIGPDYLLALFKDPADVEYVQLCELTRPE